MTQKDIELIEKAKKLKYWDWMLVSDMEKEADTKEAKEKLHNIASHLYHTDEYYGGLL